MKSSYYFTCFIVLLFSCNHPYKIGKPINLSRFHIPYEIISFHGDALFEYMDAHGAEKNQFEIYPAGIKRVDTLVQYPVFQVSGLSSIHGWLTVDTVHQQFLGIIEFDH